MRTECNREQLEFLPLGRREVTADFQGGQVTSDAGGLLLREVNQATGIIERFASCFTDHRDPDLIEHSVSELAGQRIYGLALGYEDLNDHDTLRKDPLLATLAGKLDPSGQRRRRERDRGAALAGKSTLNRLELTPADATPEARYKKIVYDGEAIQRFFVETFVDAHPRAPEQIVLDFDATDDRIHGGQEGRFFHGYYRHYCYLPLYVFCDRFLLAARLRSSNIDASAGTEEELERIVGQIRQRWPEVKIIVRADSGFARESIMAWCEQNRVDYVLGLAQNPRLIRSIAKQREQVRRKFLIHGKPARRYRDFTYRTLQTWSRRRRVVGKAEHLDKGANPRFVVTSLSKKTLGARDLYEKLYCARGEMENRIKEQQLELFADRTSSATMRANQLRLWFASAAYVLMNELRRTGLKGTELERAQVGTIRLKVLKVGAVVKVTARRVWVHLSSGCPYRDLICAALRNLKLAYYPLRM